MIASGGPPEPVRFGGRNGYVAALQRAAAVFAVLGKGYWQSRFLDRRHGGFTIADRAGLLETAASSARSGPLPTVRWVRAAVSPARRGRVVPQAGKHVVAHARSMWSLARCTDKLWWVQAEGLLALLQRLERSWEPLADAAFSALVDWVVTRQLDLRRGAWIWATDAGGRPSNFVRASSWKAGYHEVRAMSRLLEAAATERTRSMLEGTGDGARGR